MSDNFRGVYRYRMHPEGLIDDDDVKKFYEGIVAKELDAYYGKDKFGNTHIVAGGDDEAMLPEALAVLEETLGGELLRFSPEIAYIISEALEPIDQVVEWDDDPWRRTESIF